ncbi:ABC transporter permease [Frondihabitans sucicola]|uniref:ABC transporter permease n=1 Tax=Frondihabitans sucicola TaxID=1268041 RepID=A0ABN6Y505_9MICO|nr:carbohydrate ABC transporter permease [Frondihabitans sucicola]BDZ50970.1 ABC transporter permease [Frondihabitans sucicola]
MTAKRGAWGRFALLVVVTAVILVPIGHVVAGAVAPVGPGGVGPLARLAAGPALPWFRNSLAVSLASVVVCVLVAAPAGYVLARGRARVVNGYALVVFVLQAFPVVTAVVPLFLLFAKVGLVDSLPGVAVVYIGTSLAAAVWMMSTAIAAVPVELEEAAWLDGCSVAGAFWRVILPGALPGILATAIFTFLLSWNDYLVALVFLRSQQNYTLAIGLESFGHSPQLALLMMLPPVILFAVFHRSFRTDGFSGSFSGR